LHIRLALLQQTKLNQSGHHLIDKHRLHLVRRSWKHHEHLAFLRHPKPWRRAVGIGQHDRALRPVGLLEVVRRHLASQPRKKSFDGFLNFGIKHQLLAKFFSNRLAGAVVTGWPQSARGDDHIGRAPALRKLFRDRVGFVGNRDIALEEHAMTPELRAKKSQVRVGCQAKQ
jgi:hypothetical protein